MCYIIPFASSWNIIKVIYEYMLASITYKIFSCLSIVNLPVWHIEKMLFFSHRFRSIICQFIKIGKSLFRICYITVYFICRQLRCISVVCWFPDICPNQQPQRYGVTTQESGNCSLFFKKIQPQIICILTIDLFYEKYPIPHLINILFLLFCWLLL